MAKTNIPPHPPTTTIPLQKKKKRKKKKKIENAFASPKVYLCASSAYR